MLSLPPLNYGENFFPKKFFMGGLFGQIYAGKT